VLLIKSEKLGVFLGLSKADLASIVVLIDLETFAQIRHQGEIVKTSLLFVEKLGNS
jgi:hypothetical protein